MIFETNRSAYTGDNVFIFSAFDVVSDLTKNCNLHTPCIDCVHIYVAKLSTSIYKTLAYEDL